MKFLIEGGLENIVFQTMAKQFRIGYDDPQYIADFLGHKLTEKEWKRLKRGVKWIMTRAGLKISDVECVVCGRKKLFPTEGRVIDGSWYNDKYISTKYWGEWVCSYRCYEKLME